MKKKVSALSIIMAAVAAAAVLVCFIIIFTTLKDKKERKEELLKYRIASEKAQFEGKRDFLDFVPNEVEERTDAIFDKDNDYDRIASEDYTTFQASMWNTDALTSDWYETLFAEPIVYADYVYNTPQELTDVVSKVCNSGNTIKQIYLGIDPAKLRKNYYESVYYDMEILSFEEYVSDNLVRIIASYPNTKFNIILPMKSLSSWTGMSEEEFEETFDIWYTFVMLMHWAPNATFTFSGDEEWLIANEKNYIAENELADEISKYMYIMNYIDNEIQGPEILEKKELVRALVEKKNDGAYSFADLSGEKVVFFGDSVLANHAQYTSSITSAISFLTGAECEDRSIGGTSASYNGNNSFTEAVSQYISSRDDSNDIASVTFAIEYGLNDYFNGAVLDNVEDRMDICSFGGALRSGIDQLRSEYPESKIILVSPYAPDIQERGNLPYREGGATIPEIADRIDDISKECGTELLDLYHSPGVSAELLPQLLADGIHPSYEYDFILAYKYAECLNSTLY